MAEKPPRTVQNNLLISVIVIIVGELMSIGKTLSIQQLEKRLPLYLYGKAD